jgi:signal transduction histidine kinase
MDEKLVPAHVHFARWFIRIRWVAIVFLILSAFFVNNIIDISIRERQIYYIAALLFILNIIHTYLLKFITRPGAERVVLAIKNEIHFQIITDLILLTLILHYSGGIENPMILFCFFHLIIASSIFSTFKSYLYVVFVLLLVVSMSALEYFGVIPHYPLNGFISSELYNIPIYIIGTGIVFAITSILIVALSHMIIYRSIKSEEAFAETNLELENKDKIKNEYVLRVTHDIKGHVAAILSCLEVIKSKMAGPLNDTQEEFASRAFERTELLSGFVKNLLNLTKIRLSHDEAFEEFSLKELIEKIIAQIRVLTLEKSIDLNVFIDNSISSITGNPLTIEELYSNLLLNAVKYTPPEGHITLSVRSRMGSIITEISDSGIGIPGDELLKVFDEFYRASNAPKEMKSSTGLGLSIAKQVVENHKGKIWVSSEEGVWTKFTFILPKNPNAVV